MNPKFLFRPVNLIQTTSIIKEIFHKLDLPADAVIPGVFNGKWGGRGRIIEFIDPSTNKTITKVQSASIDDFNDTIHEMNKAKLIWREVIILSSNASVYPCLDTSAKKRRNRQTNARSFS